MDDDLLIEELVDSDDEVRMEADIFFRDLSAQHSARLLKLFYQDMTGNSNEMKEHFKEDRSNKDKEQCPLSSNDSVEDAQVMHLTRTVDAQHDSHAVDAEMMYLSHAEPHSQEDFVQLFRMKPSLVKQIATLIQSSSVSLPEPNVPPKQQMLATLYYLGQEKVTIEEICNRFSLNYETFVYILNRVTFILCGERHRVISLPCCDQQKKATKTYFAQNNGLQGAIGCIDTLPVKVSLSTKDEKSDISSHELVILQAIVNEHGKFLHTHVSQTAGTDQSILETSNICKGMSSCCSGEEYFLGGATYKCEKHLLTPYSDSDNLSGHQIYFNLRLAACMASTDAAFKLLTQRFRRLADMRLPVTPIANQVVTACCVLHNMADKTDFDNINEPPVVREAEIEGYSRFDPQTFQHFSAKGFSLRDKVCQQLR